MASLKAHVFFNDSREHRFVAYHTGDPLIASRLRPIPYEDFGANDEGDTEWTRACEYVFRMLNLDSRPNGKYERSLSVSDVIVLEQNGELRGFACSEHDWVSFDITWFDEMCPLCRHDHRERGGDRYIGDVLTATPSHDDICGCEVPQPDW